MTEIKHALLQWKDNILFGTGLGAKIELVTLIHISPQLIDNSYVFILWKTGLVGFTLFILILFNFIKKGIKLFLKLNQTNEQWIVAAITSGFIGLMFIGLTNTCLVHYRFIILWALAFAYIETMYKKYFLLNNN